MTTRERHERYDVVVVGGGSAGLAGALALSRARRRVLVVDAGEPRNAPAGHVHNVLGREGTPPGELLATGRREVAGYGGTVVDGRVAALARADGGFRVDLGDGRAAHARRLLVATGLTDELPDVPGVAEQWGRGVVFCPYCHGWEVRDRPVAVLAAGPQAAVQALIWRQLTDDVVLLTDGGPAPDPDQRALLDARGVRVVGERVAGLDVAGGALAGVRLADGTVLPRHAMVVAPRFRANAGLLAPLGVEPVDQVVHGAVRGTRVPADPTGRTDVPGLWVAGNLADVTLQVMAAAAHGVAAAAAINVDLVLEDAGLAAAAVRREAS
ncbi:NAD(P)/FAD-dependent oxidoreductase [Cellulomonas pakistanensis]|uniref:FAD-dependent pyridine nucleotide-disulphide oxidoreductase n=1 Tax=Cellulomonas pakistanensis TaxID=992287 RepID=A0A919P9N9_9CELL|nr:NAD(P)/FAD-dependent oxidoreductase [Cellulomonas pakistanensis]GIG35555.1 putative FAD-dependent pyridine nucleotide-disulphide oxidoreductase [Cellulomonas pakistanensis]